MPDEATLERRLRAVERSITDSDHDVADVRDAGELTERVETLESDLEDARDRIAELEAATQALRGYVGNVRSVNEDVERRADAALAAVDRLEDRLDDPDRTASHGRSTKKTAVDGGTRPQTAPHTRTPASASTTDTQTTNTQTMDRPVAGQSTETNSPTAETPSSNGTGPDGDDDSLVQRVRRVL